ncbi:MAG: GerMN domain-containing protein [Clostridia bacterium]|nr:GerMN domain-containing protein [Clostridia bacterium]
MKNKTIFFILIIIIIGVLSFVFINYKRNKTKDIAEYTPQEEISEDQMKETIVTLYFLNSETKELKSEGKLLCANELIENPYKKIVELLIAGPTNSNLQNVFPENTRILDTNLENNCITLNFSEELLNYKDDVQKYNIVNSILNSLTQLNEVNSIKILVNNKSAEKFDEEYSAIY